MDVFLECILKNGILSRNTYGNTMNLITVLNPVLWSHLIQMKAVFLSSVCENVFQSTGGKTIKIFRVLSVTVDIKLTVLNTIMMSLE